jgi:hypothetical protein
MGIARLASLVPVTDGRTIGRRGISGRLIRTANGIDGPISMDTAQDQKDRRSDPRTTVRRCGWLSRTRGERVVECVVWDVSDTGARLVTDAADEIPDTFYIYMSLDFSSRRVCRAVWRSGKQIGVEFVN